MSGQSAHAERARLPAFRLPAGQVYRVAFGTYRGGYCSVAGTDLEEGDLAIAHACSLSGNGFACHLVHGLRKKILALWLSEKDQAHAPGASGLVRAPLESGLVHAPLESGLVHAPLESSLVHDLSENGPAYVPWETDLAYGLSEDDRVCDPSENDRECVSMSDHSRHLAVSDETGGCQESFHETKEKEIDVCHD